jgi:hypothetical protein
VIYIYGHKEFSVDSGPHWAESLVVQWFKILNLLRAISNLISNAHT